MNTREYHISQEGLLKSRNISGFSVTRLFASNKELYVLISEKQAKTFMKPLKYLLLTKIIYFDLNKQQNGRTDIQETFQYIN